MSDAPSPDDDIDTLARLAAQRPPEDRGDFLRDICPNERTRRAVWKRLYELFPEKKDEFDSKSSSDESAFTSLSDEPTESPKRSVEDVLGPDKQTPPDRVGPWQIRSKMGENPLVTTYFVEHEAEEENDEKREGEPEPQRAALKLAYHSLDKKNQDEARERFCAELQILEQFRHPNVATLLDGGITDLDTDHGWSFCAYFAMEYVDGLPLYTYCNDNGLGVEPRLRLFRQVCEAVAFSHRNLILRHDLKPWDVLITAPPDDTDTGPQATLLDVGLKTALEGAKAQTGGLRRRKNLRLDIRYTSPEQVEKTLVTTASDVYSLGVVLCELLTGELPYVNFWKNSIPEIAEIIGNASVNRPSKRVPSDGEPSELDPSTVEAYGTSPEALRRTLEGDLDAIVMKALRRNPKRRYPSAVELGKDIQRYLDGQAVEAQLE